MSTELWLPSKVCGEATAESIVMSDGHAFAGGGQRIENL